MTKDRDVSTGAIAPFLNEIARLESSWEPSEQRLALSLAFHAAPDDIEDLPSLEIATAYDEMVTIAGRALDECERLEGVLARLAERIDAIT